MAEFGQGLGRKPNIVVPSKSSGTTLEDILAQNERSRERIAEAGVEDPTKKTSPSALERIFGPLQTTGALISGALYNIAAEEDEDVNLLENARQAFLGEEYKSGEELLAELGVNNKWAQFIGGLAIDILTDPLTYVTLGYGAAAKSAGSKLVAKVATYGDDVVSHVDDIAKAVNMTPEAVQGFMDTLKAGGYIDDAGRFASWGMDTKTSGDIMSAAYKAAGQARKATGKLTRTKGGLKWLGMQVPGTEEVATRLGFKGKQFLRGTGKVSQIWGKPAKWAELTFGAKGLGEEYVDVFRKGNEVFNLVAKEMNTTLGRNVKAGDFLAAVEAGKVSDLLGKDKTLEAALTKVMSQQFSDATWGQIGAVFQDMQVAQEGRRQALKKMVERSGVKWSDFTEDEVARIDDMIDAILIKVDEFEKTTAGTRTALQGAEREIGRSATALKRGKTTIYSPEDLAAAAAESEKAPQSLRGLFSEPVPYEGPDPLRYLVDSVLGRSIQYGENAAGRRVAYDTVKYVIDDSTEEIAQTLGQIRGLKKYMASSTSGKRALREGAELIDPDTLAHALLEESASPFHELTGYKYVSQEGQDIIDTDVLSEVADALQGGRSRNRRVSLEDLLDRTQSEMEAAGEDVTAHWNETIAGWRRQAELARVSGNEKRALQYEKRIAELEDLLGGGGRKVVRPGEEDLFFQAAPEVAEEAPVAAKGAAEVESIFTPAVENVPEHIRELTREVRTLARQLGADVKKSSNLRRAKNAYLEYDKALKDAAARLQGLYNDFDPEFVRNGLREMNLFTDEQIEDAIKAAEQLRADYVKTLGRRSAAGLDAKEFLPGAERGYVPSMAPLPRTEKEALAEVERLKQIGVPTEDLRELEKVSSPWQQATMTPKAQGTKQYPTPLHATEGKSLDELLRAEKGIVSPFAEEAPQGVAREFNAPALLERKLQADTRAIEYKKFTDQIMQLVPDEKEAQKLIGATKSLFTDDESTKGLLKVLDTFTNFWKRQATIFRFPGFQSRNMITNKILMAQDGALSLGGEQRSFDLLKRAYAKKPTEDDIALVEDLIRNGVLTSFEEVSEQIAGKAGSRVTRFLGKTNEIIENQSRISAYLTYKAKGYAPAVAGDMVNTSLFNYSDEVLSTFEANFIRRLVPFYKWMKSNVSKQTRLLVTMPGAVTWVGHLKEAGESVTDYDKENIPKWLRDLYPIPLPITDSKTGEPVMLSTAGLFPQGDLEILSGLLNLKYDPKDFFGTLTPILRTPLEILFNKDLWYDSEIERYKGEKKRLPAGLEKTADAMSQVEGLSDVWAFVAKRLAIEEIQDENGDYYWNAPGKALKVLRDMSPWFNQVNKLLDVQAKTPYDVTMAVTGVKPILVEEERFAKQKAYEERAELQDLIQRLKDEGRMGDARETATTSLAQVFGGGLGGTNRR